MFAQPGQDPNTICFVTRQALEDLHADAANERNRAEKYADVCRVQERQIMQQGDVNRRQHATIDGLKDTVDDQRSQLESLDYQRRNREAHGEALKLIALFGDPHLTLADVRHSAETIAFIATRKPQA